MRRKKKKKKKRKNRGKVCDVCFFGGERGGFSDTQCSFYLFFWGLFFFKWS